MVAADIITVVTAGASRSRTDKELTLRLLLLVVVVLVVLFFSCLIVLRRAKWCKIVKDRIAAAAGGAFEQGKCAAFFFVFLGEAPPPCTRER